MEIGGSAIMGAMPVAASSALTVVVTRPATNEVLLNGATFTPGEMLTVSATYGAGTGQIGMHIRTSGGALFIDPASSQSATCAHSVAQSGNVVTTSPLFTPPPGASTSVSIWAGAALAYGPVSVTAKITLLPQPSALDNSSSAFDIWRNASALVNSSGEFDFGLKISPPE